MTGRTFQPGGGADDMDGPPRIGLWWPQAVASAMARTTPVIPVRAVAREVVAFIRFAA
jgi:hypothetical protein